MLDDVERRRFLVEPSREDALPPPLRVADVELDEGAGELLNLPRRRRLARPKANDRVADPNRLARLEGQRARDTVALVEEAEHRDPLRHRGRAGGDARDGLRNVDGLRLARRLAITRLLLLHAPVAADQRGQSDESGAEREPHAWSGVHAS
jgi:hypothetical protein